MNICKGGDDQVKLQVIMVSKQLMLFIYVVVSKEAQLDRQESLLHKYIDDLRTATRWLLMQQNLRYFMSMRSFMRNV
jgi:hypothetical protein